jgi:hypothetical protein
VCWGPAPSTRLGGVGTRRWKRKPLSRVVATPRRQVRKCLCAWVCLQAWPRGCTKPPCCLGAPLAAKPCMCCLWMAKLTWELLRIAHKVPLASQKGHQWSFGPFNVLPRTNQAKHSARFLAVFTVHLCCACLANWMQCMPKYPDSATPSCRSS